MLNLIGTSANIAGAAGINFYTSDAEEPQRQILVYESSPQNIWDVTGAYFTAASGWQSAAQSASTDGNFAWNAQAVNSA